MSESEMLSISGEPPTPPPSPRRGLRRRLRRFFLRHLPLTAAGAAVFLVLFAVGFYFIASSAAFENMVRERLIAEIEDLTGGRTEIASFHWRLLRFQAQADGLVIHGLEDPGEAPYARIDSLRVHVSLRNLFSPSIRLRSLEIERPSVHFIVYADGSTNQPQPRKKRKSGKPAIDTLFELHAGRVTVSQGSLHFESRATEFDWADRYAPLDFDASDLSLLLRYVPASRAASASYHVEAGVTDLDLARSVSRSPGPVHGRVQATLDLERARADLRSLRLTAHSRGVKDRTLEVTGAVEDFTHPRWQAKVAGDLDMRLIDPVTGYPYAPEGIAHLELAGGGAADAFHVDGGVHVDGGAFTGNDINAIGVNLDARVHADPQRLQITQIVARLRQGGQIEGALEMSPWLPADTPAIAQQAAVGAASGRAGRDTIVRTPDALIHSSGKVDANFRNVALDTILDMVCAPAYRRLGFDARVNGPASATWAHGDDRSIAISANFALSPSAQIAAGEAPASGVIDGAYTHRNGAVDLRKLELHLPLSDLEAHGQLGVYPVTSPSGIAVDFRSRNMAEFDAVLRALDFGRNGRIGVAALPVTLAGQAEFHGSWAGSLARPHLAGNLKATQISLEMSAMRENPGQPRFVHLDSIDASGAYSPTQIAVQHAQFTCGKSKIAFGGTLDASPRPGAESSRRSAGFEEAYNANSTLHAHFEAASVDVAEVRPFFAEGESLPVEGVFDTRLQADGPLHAPAVSGWVEMTGGSLYGEPVSRLRAQGVLANHLLKVSSASLGVADGNLSGSGSFDFNSRRFQFDSHGAGIDVSRIGYVRRNHLEIAGKLTGAFSGSGTPDDPRLEGRAGVSGLALRGQRFHAFEVTAHTVNHALAYNATAQLQGAALALKGQTRFGAGYETRAQLDFSRFNIGVLFKMAGVEAFSGESALAGTIAVAGPLAHPEQLRGDARLHDPAVTIAGIRLQGEGGAHATLANSRIHLDPLHIVGEDTDLRAQGSLSIQGERQLDLAASGSFNLKLAEMLDPDLTASGLTTFQLEAHGPLANPGLQGRVDFQNGALSLGDLPNGLSQLHGTLEFNQNRLEVRSLTAMSGGGLLSVGGYLAYQHGIYADLSVTGKQVRIRYPQGVTSLADASLQLQGTRNNLLLGGNVLITRFTASPDLDLASFAAQTSASTQTIAPPEAPSNHVRLDVHIVSSPQLNFQNAFAKLAGNVDLHLRGTLASPSLLGRVSIAEGSALIAGTRYELQRGDVTFTNPVRIEPNIDLSATARVEDYDISLGLHGSPQKLAVSYRSDPPLPEADVVSLLALGHTSSQQRLYTQQQEQAIANPTDALLGGALNATVSSRVQKLFGAGSVKVDPNYLGAFGNSTSRVTVEEQFGRTVVLTYATNVNTTSQQLLQAEVAINRHVSLVVARDESGVFSMVVKATRRYR